MVLGDVVVDLRRGSLTSFEAKSAPKLTLHASDIEPRHFGQWLTFGENLAGEIELGRTCKKQRLVVAEPGDIVVGRLGRNAETKIIGIGHGRVALSDWLFRLRVVLPHRKAVLQSLASEDGLAWLRGIRYGTATLLLSRQDFLGFPLSIRSTETLELGSS